MKSRKIVLISWLSFLLLCIASLPIAYSLTLYENNTAGGSSYIQLWTFYASQNFTVGSVDHTISQLEMYLKQSGTPLDNVTVGLRKVSSSGIPNGGNLISFQFNASIITTSYAWYNFSFSGSYTVTAGSTFCFVAHQYNGVSGKEVQWSYATGNPYAYGNAMYSYDGGSWTKMATADLSFKVYGDAVHPTYNNTGQTSTEKNSETTLYSCWTEGNSTMQLSGYILCWNETDNFVNDTWIAFSSPSSAWANITHTISTSLGKVIQWFLYVNCTDGVWYDVMIRQNFTVTIRMTYYFTEYGTLELNGTSVTNSSIVVYSSVSTVRLEALPNNASFSFLNFTFQNGYSTENRYNMTLDNSSSAWCYFGLVSEAPPDESGVYLGMGFLIGLALCVIALALSKK